MMDYTFFSDNLCVHQDLKFLPNPLHFFPILKSCLVWEERVVYSTVDGYNISEPKYVIT